MAHQLAEGNFLLDFQQQGIPDSEEVLDPDLEQPP
jgi:hypothetical protein